MMHLKNRNPGFSFIEVMIALTLLAIFGSSLFFTQTSLFAKLIKTHTTFINMLETDQQLLKFNQQVQQALL
jgi:prepilin-type N-terminal cleavage/methylation domain-containing protein